MGNLFGIRRRAPIVTKQDRLILELKQQRDRIKIYQKMTESRLASNNELALKLFENGMKDRAIIVLRRKKTIEDIISRCDKQLETLEQMVSDIEFTQIQVDALEAFKAGTEAFKQINSLVDIEDIHQMMADNAEAAEKQREISAILQQMSVRYDEQDLLNELEKYKNEQQPQQQEKKQQKESEQSQETPPVESEQLQETSPSESEQPQETLQVKLDNLPEVPKTEVENRPREVEQQGEEVEPEDAQVIENGDGKSRPKERRKMLVADSS